MTAPLGEGTCRDASSRPPVLHKEKGTGDEVFLIMSMEIQPLFFMAKCISSVYQSNSCFTLVKKSFKLLLLFNK